MKRVIALLAIGVCMSSTVTGYAANGNWKRQFAQVSDEYFDQVYFPYAPTNGTLAGYHQYDARLENYSRKTIDAEIAALKSFEKRIEARAHRSDPPRRWRGRFCAAERPRDCAGHHSLAVVDARNDPPLGEERGQLFERLRQWRICADGAQIRHAGRAVALARRARKADVCAIGRCARELEESAAHLHRNCHRAVAGHCELF